MSEIHHILNKQITRWNNERRAMRAMMTQADHETAVRPIEIKPIVTISRQRGCRGREFSKLLSQNLHYGMIDRELIQYIAKHMGVKAELVEMLDEHDKSQLELSLRELMSGKIFNHDKYIRELTEAVKSCALNGGVVILGRGANYILHGSHVYRIRLAAPIDHRIETLMRTEGYTAKDAKSIIEKSDNERAHFVERYFKHNIDDPTEYDMVLNTGTHTLNGMVKTVISALRSHGWGFEKTGGDMRVRERSAV